MSDTRPIGVFDSGVGGLTVANAIRYVLPNENMIYYGDTSHLPYGDKSPETICNYSRGIAEFLIAQECKVIVIACNSASANAYEEVRKIASAGGVQVVNVIDPVVDHIVKEPQYKHIGVIGTKSTINSNSYQSKIKEKRPELMVSSLATPLFVPMIEEGFVFDDISNAIIRTYLANSELEGIEGLILGCTHYPIIKNQISKYYNFSVDVVDSAKIVAAAVRDLILVNNLQCVNNNHAYHKFYVSDITNYFRIIAKMFFEEDVDLVLMNIWD